MEFKPSSELGHRLSDLLIGASYRDLKILSSILQNCKISLNSEKSILFLIGKNDWSSLQSFSIPALDKILSLFPTPPTDEDEWNEYKQDINDLLDSIESFEPVQIQTTLESYSPYVKDLVLDHLSKILINGGYKKNKEISRVLQHFHFNVDENSKIWYHIGLSNWIELRKFGYQTPNILFEYLKEAKIEDYIEIVEGLLQLNEVYIIDGLYQKLSEDRPLIDSINEEEQFKCQLISSKNIYLGKELSRVLIRLLSLRPLLADDNKSSILRDYADILVPWLQFEAQNTPNIQDLENILRIIKVISSIETFNILIDLHQIFFKLVQENIKEAENYIIPLYLKIFDKLIIEDDWERINQLASIFAKNRGMLDFIPYFTQKQLLYYWIGIKEWKHVELFEDINRLVSSSFFNWLPYQFPHQSVSNLISLAIIYQKGNTSIPYSQNWYELFQWLQIGIALYKKVHQPIDQFGSPIITKVVSLFNSGNEKEQEFLFLQLLRYDITSIEKALDLSEKSQIEYIKLWAIERFEDFTFGALVTFIKAFHVKYKDVALHSHCIQMLFAIGNSANHLIKDLLFICERGRELILNILPTTTGDNAKFLIEFLLQNDNHEQFAQILIKSVENVTIQRIYLEREKVKYSSYISEILTKISPEQAGRIITIINRYLPGGIKEFSVPNFNIVTQYLGEQFTPRSKSELEMFITLYDLFVGSINNTWNEENLACYYIGHSDWIKLKDLGTIGIKTLLQIFIQTKEDERLFIKDAFEELEKLSILNCINSFFNDTKGITLFTEITNISNLNEVASIFIQIFNPEYVHSLVPLDEFITVFHRKEFGIWLNQIITKGITLSELTIAVHYLDYLNWYIFGIEAKNCYRLIKKEWAKILDSQILPEKIGDQLLQNYLCDVIIHAKSCDIPFIANILTLSGYSPDNSICGVYYTIGIGNWMDITKYGDYAIPPLLSLLSSEDPRIVKRAIHHLDLDIGIEKITKYVSEKQLDNPRLVAPIISEIKVSHPDAIRFCISLFSNKDGNPYIVPDPNAYTIWLHDYILPYTNWEDLVFALKILDINDISIIEGNAFKSIINLWKIVESLGDNALPLYIRLLFSHNSFLIDKSIEKLTKIGIERVIAYLLHNSHSTEKIFSEYETPDKKAIQYILRLLSQDALTPIIPQKKVCSWFRRTLPYFAWCDLYKAASLIEKFCIPEPFLRNRYYIIGKRQWEDIRSLFSDEPERLSEYLSQAPDSDQARIINILGDIGDLKNINHIYRCLDSPYSTVIRVSAIGALTKLVANTDNYEKMKFLFKRIEMLSDSDQLIINELINSLNPVSKDEVIDCIIAILEKDSINANYLMASIMGTEKNPNAVQYILDLLSDPNLSRCEELYALLRNRSETLLKFWLNQLKRKYPLFIRKIITIEGRLNIGCQVNRS